MNSREYFITDVKVSDIDLSDRSFRISRPVTDDRTSRLVERFGQLTIPLITKAEKGFILLTGQSSEIDTAYGGRSCIRSIVIDESDWDLYVSETVMMVARGEVGPLGRLKALSILKKHFRMEESRVCEIGRDGYLVPDDFLRGDEIYHKIEEFPPELKDYLERRDISFKIIRILLKLSGEVIEILAGWVRTYPLRVNIFRDLAEMILDLQRGGNISAELRNPPPEEIADQRQFEKYLYKKICSLRFPQYSQLKKKAEVLAAELQSESVEIRYPEYFENSQIRLIVTVEKRTDLQLLSGRLEELLQSSRLRNLLDIF